MACAQGHDHIWLSIHDEGACWFPTEIYENSTMLTHWGRWVRSRGGVRDLREQDNAHALGQQVWSEGGARPKGGQGLQARLPTVSSLYMPLGLLISSSPHPNRHYVPTLRTNFPIQTLTVPPSPQYYPCCPPQAGSGPPLPHRLFEGQLLPAPEPP